MCSGLTFNISHTHDSIFEIQDDEDALRADDLEDEEGEKHIPHFLRHLTSFPFLLQMILARTRGSIFLLMKRKSLKSTLCHISRKLKKNELPSSLQKVVLVHEKKKNGERVGNLSSSTSMARKTKKAEKRRRRRRRRKSFLTCISRIVRIPEIANPNFCNKIARE